MIEKKSALPPEQYAREVLCLLGIEGTPTPVIEICEAFDLEIVYEDIDADGILVRQVDRNLMIVKDHMDSYEARQFYTIAHELGHFYLPWHRKNSYICNKEDMHNFQSMEEIEHEANRFASELLMPDPQFSSDVKRSDLIMSDVMALSNKYQTSLTSTAIRMAKRSDLSGAIICCKDGRISWVVKTHSAEDFEFRSGRLSEQTYAHDVFLGKPIDDRKLRVHSIAWLSNIDFEYDDYTIYEQTLPMPRLNQTLSIITIDEGVIPPFR